METLHEPVEAARLDPEDAPSEAWLDRFDLGWLTLARLERAVEAVVVVIAVGFVLGQLGLGNLLMDTTATGGDMGAHVWGPAFLRDHLLPQGRLSGWTPDWYDGFPAYQFYMVLPALMVVVLNAGFHGYAAVVPIVVAGALAVAAVRFRHRPSVRRALIAAGVVVLVLGVGFPYNVAFKLVTVLGVLTLPIAMYAFARLAGLPFPAPALFAIASLTFLFNREPVQGGTGNIIGGNLTSTLAGEFSFSLALTFGVLFLGVLAGGLRTGRHRWLAAVLFALTVLCHVIVGIFAAIAAAVALVVWPGLGRLRWLAAALPVGGLLSAFWTFPFVARHQYVNDMGWSKLPAGSGSHSWTYLVGQFLTDSAFRNDIVETYLAPTSLRWLLVFALIGFIVSCVLRIRVGIWLGLVSLTMAFAFVVAPESRLWNARLLPFYYLCVCMLAALGAAELGRALALLVARDVERPVASINFATAAIGVLTVLIVVGLPLKLLPGETSDADGFKWLFFRTSAPANPAPYWARWNYRGYEDKPAYVEYHDLIEMMASVGRERGCGRAMWEYDDPRLERYGTPMAPMLVSYWTDGCIGSMEGLYFESSMTTPFHFINQRELSTACSCAQRNLPYGQFDVDLGVKHLQLLGVKYYVASTDKAVEAASNSPDLREVASTDAWRMYEVADAPLVVPLANEPAVVTDHSEGIEWTYGTSDPHTAPKDAEGRTITANGPAMTWYTDPSKWDVFLASDGPSSWARVRDGETPPTRPVSEATVSNVATTTDTIDFDVDRVGTPILVKASYFPNWKVDGADGPYRVTPNLMVVIPTTNHVRLSYGNTSVEYLAYLLTLVGIGLTILLARRPPVPMPDPTPMSDDLYRPFLAGPVDADDQWAVPEEEPSSG